MGVPHITHERQRSCPQGWGSFLTSFLPVCSLVLSVFLPPWLCSLAKGWGTFSKKSCRAPLALSHMGFRVSAVALPLALPFPRYKTKAKQKTTTNQKPHAEYGSCLWSQGKGLIVLSVLLLAITEIQETSLAPFLPLWPPPHTYFCFHWQSPYSHRLDKSAFMSICSSPLNVLAPSETTHLKRGIWRRPARPQLSPGLLRSMEETCIGGILEQLPSWFCGILRKDTFLLKSEHCVCVHVFTILYKKV